MRELMYLQEYATRIEVAAETLFIITDTIITTSQFIPIKIISSIINMLCYSSYILSYLLFLISLVLTNKVKAASCDKKEKMQQKIHNLFISPMILLGLLAALSGIAALAVMPHIVFIALILAVISEGLFFLSDTSFLVTTILAFTAEKNGAESKKMLAEFFIGAGITYVGACLTTIAVLDLIAIELSTAASIIINFALPGIGVAVIASAWVAHLVFSYLKEERSWGYHNDALQPIASLDCYSIGSRVDTPQIGCTANAQKTYESPEEAIAETSVVKDSFGVASTTESRFSAIAFSLFNNKRKCITETPNLCFNSHP
jgi:hypothetical protein